MNEANGWTCDEQAARFFPLIPLPLDPSSSHRTRERTEAKKTQGRDEPPLPPTAAKILPFSCGERQMFLFAAEGLRVLACLLATASEGQLNYAIRLGRRCDSGRRQPLNCEIGKGGVLLSGAFRLHPSSFFISFFFSSEKQNLKTSFPSSVSCARNARSLLFATRGNFG
jgi:hypothetical protein